MIRPEEITNWDIVRDALKVRIKNQSSVQKHVSGITEQVEDLTLEYVIDMSGDMTQTAVFQENILPTWGVTREEVISIAKQNVLQEPMLFMPLTQMLFGVENKSEDPCPYVVTIGSGSCYGARPIILPENQEIISKELGGDFYILPSSVHEVLVLPADRSVEVNDLRKMVTTINYTEVSSEDWLSDNVYLYDSKAKEIKIASGQKKQNKNISWLQSLKDKEDSEEQEEKDMFRR